MEIVKDDDIDSILMPPPPPRLPKRQRLESTDPEASGTVVSDAARSTPHDSIFSHRHQKCAAVDLCNNDVDNSGGGEKERFVSPDEFDAKIVACVGKGGGMSMSCRGSENDFVVGLGKNLAGAFDLANDKNSSAVNNNEKNRHDFRNYVSISQNYDPPASSTRTINETIVSECDGNKFEAMVKDFATKGNKAQLSHRYDIPPINTSFRDIIGHGQAKLRLDEALLPLALPPDLAHSVLSGIRAAPASILLHGPPGCGKTKLAKAVAGEAQAAFISVGPSDILSKFVGESEASIRGLFREARERAKKMESKCTVVFFDEIDALGRSRVDEGSGGESQTSGDHSSRRVLAELLIQMTNLSNNTHGEEEDESEDEDCDDCDDNSFACQSTLSTAGSGSEGYSRHNGDLNERAKPRSSGDDGNKDRTQPRVIVVAATNRPEDCDPALLRRFAVRVLVGLPTRKDRKKIIKRLLNDVDHTITAAQLEELAVATEGWSGSDLESMTREAVMAPVRECLRAAAILKKKEGNEKQRSGAESSHADEQKQKREEDVHSSTRETLLNSFRSLRPVSSKDFGDGIAFFLGEQQENMSLGHLSRHAHYDSSSSSEDDDTYE